MKIINNRTIISAVLCLSFFTMLTVNAIPRKKQVRRTSQAVYICTGPKAAVYHRTNHCSGLNRCSGDIVSVSLSKAKGMGRRRARSVIRL